MTREEAIRHLYTYSTTMGSGQTSDEQHNEAKRMAIEALHREEAEEKGYCHRIRPSNVEVVVRCKDCRHFTHYADGCGVCNEKNNILTYQNQNDFCSYGERKGGDDE